MVPSSTRRSGLTLRKSLPLLILVTIGTYTALLVVTLVTNWRTAGARFHHCVSPLEEDFLASPVPESLHHTLFDCNRNISSTRTPALTPIITFKDIQSGTIFFFETSPLPFLMPKQLCSLESAAIHHPDREIMLAVTNPCKLLLDNTFSPVHRILDSYKNIRLHHVDFTEWFAFTDIGGWSQKEKLRKCKYSVANISDALRLVALLKHGGIYLDLDSIVLRSMDGLTNAVGIQYPDVNGGVLVFDKNHTLIAQAVAEFVKRFDGDKWAINGPILLTNELVKWCGLNFKGPMIFHPMTCHDVHILSPNAFYPIYRENWKDMFENDANTTAKLMKKLHESYVLTFWNSYSAKLPIVAGSSSLLGQIAGNHCPVTSNAFGGMLWGIDSRR